MQCIPIAWARRRRYKPVASLPAPLEARARLICELNLIKDSQMAGTRTLAATARQGTGKGAARSVRREGRIPAVIYGGGDAAEPIALDYRELNKLIYAGHFLTTIFELDVGGVKQRVIPRDYRSIPSRISRCMSISCA